MAYIRQYKNGHWQAVVRHKGYPAKSASFTSRPEAARWARLIESEMDRGLFLDRTDAERTTVGQLIERYLAEVTPSKKSARQERQRLLAISNHFGAFTAASLRNTHIAAYRDERLRSGCAGATVVKEMNSLSHLIDTAIKDWGIGLPVNPSKLVRKPKVSRGRDRRLNPGEEAKLFAACNRSRCRMLEPVVRFAIETGMRMGEILSLTWQNVDAQRRVATLPDTKSGDARQVPLSTAAISAILPLPRHIKDGRVFWTWSRSDSLENAYRRAVKWAGIEDLHFHDLRHEAVSRLFELELNPMEVSAISGHKTLQMLKRYTHLRAEDLALKLG